MKQKHEITLYMPTQLRSQKTRLIVGASKQRIRKW